MRCLMFNTKEIEFERGDCANRPNGVISVPSDIDSSKFHSVTIVFICIEEGDNKGDSMIILDEIRKYYDDHKLPVLVVPFAHLSSNVECSSKVAYQHIKFISDKLMNENISEKGAIGFGYDRAFIAKWVTILHKGNVAFRDSRRAVGYHAVSHLTKLSLVGAS